MKKALALLPAATKKYYRLFFFLILGFAFLTRIANLHYPAAYIFDEVYHVPTAKLIALNDHRAFEWWQPPPEPKTAIDWLHPPLAKYFQAASIKVFGNQSFSWRFSSVIFGVLAIAATMKLAQLIFTNRNISLLAGLLASLDGLLLVQSRIAMNDIHVTFFILLTLIFYYQKIKTGRKLHLFLAGLAAGLSLASKWSGAWAWLFILIWESIIILQQLPKRRWRQSLQSVFLAFIFLIILPIIIYIAGYGLMFYQGRSFVCRANRPITGQCYRAQIKIGSRSIWQGYWSHFAELHHQIWLYQTGLKATHPYQSRPWQWFLNLRPVWFFVNIDQKNNTRGDIYAFGNPVLFWSADLAILATLAFLIFDFGQKTYRQIASIFNKKLPQNSRGKLQLIRQSQNKQALLFLLGAYFIVWLPWQFSPRIMFFYHYTPAVPLLSIVLAFWLDRFNQLKRSKISLLTLAAIAIAFFVFYPHWTGLNLPLKFVNSIYFFLPGWK